MSFLLIIVILAIIHVLFAPAISHFSSNDCMMGNIFSLVVGGSIVSERCIHSLVCVQGVTVRGDIFLGCSVEDGVVVL